ncbi:MAG TPA: helix-turn-helix domain-containing protein, partial [Chloroflexota bacterium]|nr:helix-turn-helix domain-containing protein [Chloroflexota bacterium]
SIAIAPTVPDWHEVQRGYDVARRALQVLALLGERGQTISTADPRLAVFLLFDSTSPELRQEFVDLVLGPLVAYDQRGGHSLMPTLDAYLAHGGNLETTARTLNVHTSTLKYRLQRIAEVGGLNVRNADHRFNAALALRLRSLSMYP